MASYILRDANGLARAKFDAERANSIMDEAEGFFRKWTSTHGRTATAFQFSDDGKYSIHGVDIYVWKGELLIPC